MVYLPSQMFLYTLKLIQESLIVGFLFVWFGFHDSISFANTAFPVCVLVMLLYVFGISVSQLGSGSGLLIRPVDDMFKLLPISWL